MLIQSSSFLAIVLVPLLGEVGVQLSGGTEPDVRQNPQHAERQQQRFERTRLQHLPWGYGSAGRCDIRIGRYCFTFDDANDWDPPPDHPDVTSARETLVAALDSLHKNLPGDEWIVTQLVRYAVEQEQYDLARDAVTDCALTDAWLCHALAGFTNHVAGEYSFAEREFDRSLALMPVAQRCEWEDMSELITGGVRGRWRALECDERAGLLDTLFWLSDPLYSVPGNELRTEHFSRHVASLMYQQARGPDRERWNATTHKIMLRYGWPTGWQRVREFHASLRPPMVTHYGADGSATFLPHTDIVEDPLSSSASDWNLDPDRPQSSHGPPYAHEAFEELSVSWSMFRHGDSTTVVYIASLSHELLQPDDSITFAVAVSEGPGKRSQLWSDTVSDTTHVLRSTSAASRQLVSLEAVARDVGVAGRSRFGIDLSRLHRTGLVASDVLVLEPTDTLPTKLEEAIVYTRLPREYAPGDRFVLYWELYGVNPDAVYSTSISLDKTSKGIFRRLAEITPFASHEPAVRVAWDDAAQRPGEAIVRSLAVDLPGELSNGEYRLTLKIDGTTGETIERTIQLVVRSRS